ncbi:helix-turn-helix domain-containing protein [Sphingomonas sp. CFBP 13706]|uniref:helix-turn-helix domain-containing protein n=1 Tax=Sphingomonas sp. CFBP 13706 TaxID=2775314 RepID=UPI0017858EA9|nr:helix-turn-helix domain-containing protein [Sphingomonas sp. CFBP 13706]MBD8737256.1 helix-turn-helix domain-containing protein [Sphingomonas sp. CFBP 13706]
MTHINKHQPAARLQVVARLLDIALDEPIRGATGKMILVVMARRANNSGKCYASIPRIAKEAGCHEPAVRTWLSKFQEEGLLLEIINGNGRQTRCFVVFPGMIDSGLHPLSKASSTPSGSDTQNPKNQNLNPRRSSVEPQRRIPSFREGASPWEAMKAYRPQHEGAGDG